MGVDNVIASNQDKGMNTTTRSDITKADLTERKRGKCGSVVTVKAGTASARFGKGPFVVKDLYQRANFNKPGQIGVGPADRGIAFSIDMADIATIDGWAEA